MPNTATHADSIRIYLTGAASDGAAQTNPDAALGGYRSASEETPLSAAISNAIAGITVDFVSGSCGAGSASLSAPSADTLTFSAPNGSAGTAVTIVNGESKIIEDGGSASKYARVTRTSASALSGTATLTLTKTYNNVLGFDNVDSGETAAGDVEYRAAMFKNVSTSQVKNLKVWISTIGTQRVSGAAQLGASGAGSIGVASGSFSDWADSGFCRIEDNTGNLKEIVYYSGRTSTTLTVPVGGRGLLGTSATAGAATDKIYCVPGLRIAKEAPTSNAIQTVANENTAPTGLTFVTGITAAGGLAIGDLAAGGLYGLWLERTVVAGATAQSSVEQGIAYSFDAA